MKKILPILIVLAAMQSRSTAWAADSVIVESKTVYAGDTAVELRIRIVNADSLSHLQVPLKFESLDGNAMPLTIRGTFDERLSGHAADWRWLVFYDDYGHSCGPSSLVGTGFKGITFDSLSGQSYPVTADPYGTMFVFYFVLGQPLYSGADSAGSLVLTLNIGPNAGSFSIDSTCTWYNNALYFVSFHDLVPGVVFVPGVVTVVEPPCDCPSQGDVAPIATNGDGAINILDLVFLIDYVLRSSGIPPSQDEYCPANRGDVQCDGIVNIVDITYVQNYIYGSGPQPCQPCDCDPYPGSCP